MTVCSCTRLYSQCSCARVSRRSSNGVASSLTLATLALIGLRSMLHVDECVVEFFAVSEYLSTSARLAATLSVTAGCCGANLRVRTMVAHDERVFPPTSQTGSDERGRVEVGFGICCASDILGACISLAVARCILKRLWSAVAAAECCCGLLWLRLAT